MPTAMANLDDMALVQMVLSGQGECFAELVHRHMTVVRSRAVSIVRNSSDAEDVVQEAFLKAWRALPTFRGDAPLRRWLMSIATNEAIMFYRRERQHRNWESPVEFDIAVCHSEPADKAVIRGEESRAIRGAILKLPRKYREIVSLCYVEELTLTAIADQLKLTMPAVKTRLHRGRLKLGAKLRGSHARNLQAA